MQTLNFQLWADANYGPSLPHFSQAISRLFLIFVGIADGSGQDFQAPLAPLDLKALKSAQRYHLYFPTRTFVRSCT